VHRHWHVRINTQREREREKTHTHTRTQTHTCAIGPKMHRLMKSSMRTHVCIMAEYITIYVYIYIYTHFALLFKICGQAILHYLTIPTNWRNRKGSQTWPPAFWPAWQPRTGIQTQPRPPKAPADWLDGHLSMLSLNVRQKQETVLTRSLHKVLMFPFE